MSRNMAAEIDSALGAFFHDGVPEGFQEVLAAALQSREFTVEVVAAQLSPAYCPKAQHLATILAVMLWAGMRIERSRRDVEVLERLYGEDAGGDV